MSLNLLEAMAGLGVFLFALRFLTNSMDESFSTRLAPSLDKMNRGFVRPLISGIVLTFIFQASSITLITSMGVLSRRLISLETGIFLMLGATIGTSLKGWYFAKSVYEIGPVLLILSSISLLFVRKHLQRKALELLFSIGLMFLGWHMLGKGLKPILDIPAVITWLESLEQTNLIGLMFAMLGGVVLAAAVQSSSTVLFLVLGLASQQAIPFLIGVAVILGANIGTTFTGLLASLEYNKDVKRLALAHFLVKLIGASMSVLLFKTFLNTLDLMYFGALDNFDSSTKLAAVHMGFNILNSLIWVLLSPFLVKMTHFFIRSEQFGQKVFLTEPVIQMLTQIPDQAMTEIERGFDRIIISVKSLEDLVFSKLGMGDGFDAKLDIQQIKGEFKAHEQLLIGVGIRDESYREAVARRLRKLTNLKLVFEELLVIKSFLDKSSGRKLEIIAKSMTNVADMLDEERDKIWLMVLKEDENLEQIHFEKVYSEIENLIHYAYERQNVHNKEELQDVYSVGVLVAGYFQRLAPFAMGKRGVLVHRNSAVLRPHTQA